MAAWIRAAALAVAGGLKGQGSHWRQLPFFGFLAATALFISWRVSRQSREDDPERPPRLDDDTVAAVNTRVYLVYDEEKKLERGGTSQSSQIPARPELEKFTDTDDLLSYSPEVEIANSQFQPSPIPSEREMVKVTDTDDLGSNSSEVDTLNGPFLVGSK
ncbi:hypothetical protein MPTK1_6g02840 [Marchantia polymorpha subsp. ruderalis]|uniref:Uncharacterized protein n=2 Tax=Marchantia polymorpha TaxID=3197 RepID=A0AAF6BMX0_MARPO|nr:hypothetical protein MARPO_0035s0071 [Marchantia polymorpha]BBN13354.1 hypothetical protein Mp_6g02840 [Marchantia polymorpha subsp. ruderalis]|eukprot:PTQ41282.1 hypothetical protein MARPO_0035s0071 [Marchantia polymorpha]